MDLVLLGNFNRHMDKPNIICACHFGLQYSHMTKLLLVHDVPIGNHITLLDIENALSPVALVARLTS